MSRRKQSHPKPIKRLPGDENIDKELEDELDRKNLEDIKEEVLPTPAHSSNGEDREERDFHNESNATSPQQNSFSSTFKEPLCENVQIKTEQTCNNSCYGLPSQEEPSALSSPPPPPPPPPSSSSLTALSSASAISTSSTSSSSPSTSSSVILSSSVSVTSPKCEILRLVKGAGDDLQVCCTIPLPKNSCLGPFCGDIACNEESCDTLLEFTEHSGKTVCVRLLEDSASWLKLLSKPVDMPKNCIVFYEDGRIWCKLIVDLISESALVASFTFLSSKSHSPKVYHTGDKEKASPTAPISSLPVTGAAGIKKEEAECSKHAINLPGSNTEIPVFSALIYQCPYCGVRFSKPSTLEGHLLYYCSKKPTPSNTTSNVLTSNDVAASGNNTLLPHSNVKKRERKTSAGSDDEGSKKIRLDSDHLVSEAEESDTCTESGSPLPKPIKVGQLYQCPCCSYSAEKLSGLNRHRRIHNRSAKESEENPPKIPILKSETFCKECNIQFSSFNTFRGHKKFYCSRRNKETGKVESPNVLNKSEIGSQSPVTSLTSVTHHLPTVPYHLTTSSSVLSTQTAVIVAAPILAPNGIPSLAFTVPTVIVQPVVTSANLTQPIQAHQTTIPTSNSSKDQPLDLSTKKDDSKSEEKVAVEPLSPTVSESSDTRNRIKEEFDSTAPERKSVSESSSSSASSSLSSSCSATTTTTVTTTTTTAAAAAAAAIAATTWSTTEPNVLNQFFKQAAQQYPHQTALITSPTGQTTTAHVSKCMECNIVFYKHENFVAHKQHYCASRRAVKTSPQISPKLSPREVAESNSSSVVLAKKSPELISKPSISLNSEEKLDLLNNSSKTHVISAESSEKKANFSYYCVPCKIKFSSASTLKAHKDYYCPHGKNSEQSLILCKTDGHSESSCSEADDNSLEDSFYTCNHCHTSYTSSRLYRHHYCPANMQNPMVRCPHCDYVAPTQNKLTEHMKAHTSSRGYKCLLCGYRGNTVRGMRMHGKTHTDSGEEFNEKHVLEVEEPPLLPVSFKNGTTTDVFGSLDMEAELIRLKNEPYKRRRSRKSYERMDISNHELLHACKICGETFSDMKAFQVHNSIHRTSPLVSHTIPRPKSVNNNKDLEDSSSTSNSQLHNIHIASCLDPNVTITPKKFKYTENADPNTPLKCFPKTSGEISPTLSQSRKVHQSYNSSAICLKYEDSKDGTLKNALNAFQPASVQKSTAEVVTNDHQTKTAPSISPLIQVKPEPIDHGYDKAENNMNGPAQSSSPSLSEIANICVKIEAEKEECSDRREAKLNVSSSPLKEEPSVSPHSKLETSNNHTPKTSPSPPPPRPSSTSSSPTAAAAPLSVLATTSSSLFVYNKAQFMKGEITDTSSNHVPETHLSKYCQQCDISFTYLATFLAHKKHYCSARFPTEPKPSVTA